MPRKIPIDKTFTERVRMGLGDVKSRIARSAGPPAVRAARDRVHRTDARTVELMTRIATVPAPTGQEARRAAVMAELLRRAGLHVHVDDAGNVIAQPQGRETRDAVILVAHLDTVFEDRAISVRQEDGRLLAPGIADNARGLAALAAIAQVLKEAPVPTTRPIVFVCSVGEEALGDLRGVRHLFRDGGPFRGASAVIALDGAGDRRIVHRGVGSRRLRLVFEGPGGHSWADFGSVNPVHALGACIAGLLQLRLPRVPRTALTVARTGGGTSVNAIPERAWAEVDLRSERDLELDRLVEGVRTTAAVALREANARRRRGTAALEMRIEPIGSRPSGETAAAHPLVQAARAVTRQLGRDPELVASSTDANVPMSLGIPAIAIGCGGIAAGTHTRQEWYENAEGATGIERALLIALAAAGVAD